MYIKVYFFLPRFWKVVNNLALSGKSLPKNSYISTGTCTPAIPVQKGDKVMANFGKLGNVSFIYK